mgnify:CR=1 FL=1
MIGQGTQVQDLGFFTAEADMRTKQFYTMEFGTASPQVDLPDANGDRCVGILQNKPNTGEAATVRVSGVSMAVVNATTDIAYGDPLKVASGGKLVKATADADMVVAFALEPATEDGDQIAVLLAFGAQRAS